jgi:hypothetical protein
MDLNFTELNQLFAPYGAILVGLIISLLARDFATSLAAGLSFKYNPQFNEGDHVMIDEEPATIIKIGYRYTVFSVRKTGGQKTWRYVKNDRIQRLKLEKVMGEPLSLD